MDIPRYIVLLIALAGTGVALYFLGFYGFLKRITIDCLVDHTTGKITINNLARFLAIFVTLYLVVVTHMDIDIKPHFKITTHRPNTELILVLLGFIIGQEAIKKIPTRNNTNPNNDTPRNE